MKSKLKPVTSFLMACIMLLTAVITAPVNKLIAGAKTLSSIGTEKTIKYVSFGDSMTTGFGIDLDDPLIDNGYLCQQETAYPVLVKNYLQKKYPDHSVELTQLAVNGTRTNDLRYALEYGKKNAYPGDDNTNTYLEFTEEVAMTYQNAVKEADYISVALGNNDFIQTFIGQALSAIKNMGNKEGSVYRPAFNPYLEYMLYENNKLIKALAETVYSQLRALLILPLEILGAKDVSGTYIPFMEEVIGYFTYAFVGFLKNYEAIMNRIVDLNSDATILLVGMSNVLKGVKLVFSLGKLNFKVDVGDIMGIMSTSFNGYMRSIAKSYNTKSFFSFKKTYKVYYVEANDVTIIGKGFGEGIDDRRRPQMIKDMIYNVIGPIKNLSMDVFEALSALDSIDISSYLSEISLEDAAECYERYIDFLTGKDLEEKQPNIGEMLMMSTYMAIEKALVDLATSDIVDSKGVFAAVIGTNSIQEVKKADKILKRDILKGIFNVENIQRAIEEMDFETYITKPLYDLILSDSVLSGYLYTVGAIFYNETRGVHPDEHGHTQYAQAIYDAIDAHAPVIFNIRNSVDKTIENIGGMINKTFNTVKTTINNFFGTIQSVFNWLFKVKVS